MKEMKRILSLVLCFAMLVGMMPMIALSADAAESDTHYLMFATDRHENTSVIGNIINNMESVIGENKLEYLALGGDMVGSSKTHPEYDSSEVLAEAMNATSSLNAENVDIVAGIHDMNVTDDAGIVLPYQGGGAQIYEGDDYYVYGVEEYCVSEDSNESIWSAQADAFKTWANGEKIDQSKVIFVVSHYPLHVQRDDNDGAYYWHLALNYVATGGDDTVERNIVFFHGHNHTTDGQEYVYNVGDTMSIQNGSSTVSDTIYYTYATAGYLNQNKKATLVTLTGDKIVLTKYGASGSGSAMTSVERVVTETAPTVNTVTCKTTYVDENGDIQTSGSDVAATGLGLTGISALWNDDAAANTAFRDCVAYDVTLEGYIEGETVTLTFNLNDMTAADLVVYANGQQIEPASVVENDGYIAVTVTTTAATGTYIIGYPAAAEDAVLTGIAVTSMPDVTSYTLVLDENDDGNIYLDITGLVITAAYDNDTSFPVEWNQFDETRDGYALDFDISVAGTRTVTVTYGGFTTSFEVTVYEHNAEDADVAEAVAQAVKEGYIAKEFNPTGYTEGTDIRVVMPAPENANVVYHVADDGTLTKVENVTFHGGYAIFDTNHFSAYVVGESTEITVPDPVTATGRGETTTTEPKTVYVLTSSITAGNDYLIVNGNAAGSYYALANNNGSVAATGVTIKSDDEIGTYIELEDATDELWTVGGSYTFANDGSYLGYTTSGDWNQTYTFGLSTTARTWSYSNNRLSTRVGSWSTTTYYLQYSSGWTWTSSSSASGRSVYFFVPTEIEVETTTTVSGTYSIEGEDVTKVVREDGTSTVELVADLGFTPAEGGETEYEPADNAVFTVVDGGDPNGIISKIEGNVVTFTGKYGKALIKVSCETAFGTVTNYITVTASALYYSLDLVDASTQNSITAPIAIKGIEKGDTYSVWAEILEYDGEITEEDELEINEDGHNIGALEDPTLIEWTSSDPSVATVDVATGIITFTGKEGTVNITATYKVGNQPSDTITISATPSQYTIPSDGTTDFPEYPNEGAIRFDKNATAVGNFSETGITQIELSMTGVPYTTGSEIDVVVMLDMTGSMSDNGMEAAEEATKAFLKKIVQNEDGTYNNNRVAVWAFNSGGQSNSSGYALYELFSFGTISSDSELETANTAIDTASDKQKSGGTPYPQATQKCYDLLKAARTDGTGNNRQQFCVFMSDGGPTEYYATSSSSTTGYVEITNDSSSGTSALATYMENYTSTSSSSWNMTLPSEYYTDLMKKDGVTVYTVGLLLQEVSSNASPWKSMTGVSSVYDSTTDSLTTIGTHYYFTSEILKQMASDESKYVDIFTVANAQNATAKFEAIAMSILQAATDVAVEDKITDEYTMIFDIPEGSKDITGVTNDFYIEFVKYTLDSTTHERTGEATSVTKVSLQNTNGVLSAKDAATPVFEQKAIGDKGTLLYWTTDSTYAAKAALSYTSGSTIYYFIPNGMDMNADGTAPEGWYNMTSGTYAYGTVDATTNMSDDVVIATPYFVYNAATKMIYWTVDKLENATTEYALRYFLYLDNSATEVGTDKETDPGSYLTNEYAFLTYTNYQGNECRQEFPKPQMTWSGAQVSYVFYLVNAAGQPINKSGQVVDFANATFVTDVYTVNTVWNKGEDGQISADSQLSIDWLAQELLPSDYMVYDELAGYELHVYGSHTGESIFDYFIIEGDTAANISESLNERLVGVTTSASTVSLTTTKVYNTKAGEKITGYGTYTSEATSSIDNETVLEGFDFYNTTVAFAVVWQPSLAPDTVVVDYGLDVLINVTFNDLMQDNTISGIGLGKDAYGDIAMNTGISTNSKLGTAALTTADGSTISIEDNKTQIRFSQNDMTFDKAVTFYYESEVKYFEASEQKTGYLYSSVTVIPATTIYYEDSFVDLTVYTKDDNDEYQKSEWAVVGNVIDATQEQDRPGTTQIAGVLDADNNYGFDAAYEDMSQYSLGAARMATVKSGTYAEAKFTFYGTGFDIISLTDKTTGFILVSVYNEKGTKVANTMVDTYYGYARSFWEVTYEYNSETEEWTAKSEKAVDALQQSQVKPENPANGATYTVYETRWTTVSSNDPNALYQVPVIKMDLAGDQWNLPYGKYDVTITVSYMGAMDHTSDEGYDFYLDAIRIYNPTGNQNPTSNDAYIADGEGWPSYFEVRNKILEAGTFEAEDTDAVDGIVYIDGGVSNPTISDYQSFGPNNEVYLAPGSAIAFELSATATAGEIAKIQLAVKSVGGSASVKVYSTDGTTALDTDIKTATDMYYDISSMNGKVVVIMNDSIDGYLSITNVKVTYTAEQGEAAPVMFMMRRSSVDAVLATMSVEEEPEVETQPTEPETQPSEPETEPSEPETEPSVPETEPSEPDNSLLQAAVDAAKKLKEKDYTKESFQAVKTARKAAEKVLKDKNATQEQIDAALAELNEAVEALEAKPSTDALKQAVDAAKKLKEKDYTKESFQAVKTARKAAEKVLKDKNATQADIDNALADLMEAVEALETKAPAAKPGKANAKEVVESIVEDIIALIDAWFGGRN